MDYLWLGLCWLLYFILHSVFALLFVKNLFYSLGLNPQVYRLIFNIFSVILLVPIFLYSSSINSEYILSSNNLSKFIGLFLASSGIFVVKIAFKSYDTKAFLGLGNIDKENEFHVNGMLRHIRHPLYSGSILLIIGYFFFNPKISTLISVGMMILYFLIGIQFEERKLIKAFGAKYLEYKKKTPMLIPRFQGKTKKNPRF